jgi:predicted metal-binding membrane protein
MPGFMASKAHRYDRARLFVILSILSVVSWAWIVVMARDMYGPMTGASAWMMTPHWDAPHLLLLWAMWAVMMIAMMLPSAMPMVMLAARGTLALSLGYISAWAVFSVAATALQWALGKMLIINPMMEASSATVGAVFLLVAGIYQWTPLKHACLTTCQSPMAFVTRHWRSGTWGAFRMGAEHGAHCVGCCWALMLLLFAGGVMNIWVIAALTVFVGFEKLVPLGVWGPRASGALLIAAAAWLFAK